MAYDSYGLYSYGTGAFAGPHRMRMRGIVVVDPQLSKAVLAIANRLSTGGVTAITTQAMTI